MTILLTDDEVVGIAANQGRQWPTILISVDTSSAQEMALAMARGTRSLVVRRLAREEAGVIQLSEELNAFIEPLFDDPVLHVYPAPVSTPGQLAGGVVYIYPQSAAGEYPVEVVFGYGLHELSRVDKEGALALLGRLVGSAFDRDTAPQAAVRGGDSSSAGEVGGRALYLSASPGPGQDAVEVSRGRVAWGSYAPAGASEGGFIPTRVSDSLDSGLPASLLLASVR